VDDPTRESMPLAPARPEDIVRAVEDRSPQGIAAALSRLVSTGSLPTGTRLPTVRAIAAALGTSPTTVSAAWQALAAHGVIEARGRLGTFVLARPNATQRYSRMSGTRPANFHLDLATGTPDPELLPDLGPALRRIGRRAHVGTYHEAHVLPQLEDRLRSRWPYPAEAFAVLDGALDALDRLIGELVRYGDRVLVENPTFPAFLDLLEQRGATAVPVDDDQDGPLPASLAAGLGQDPVAFVYQPRAQNPTGASLTEERLGELAEVLRGSTIAIVEDDHAGDISVTPDLSLGSFLPGQTTHVRSYSKSHGPDLRLAALGGPWSVVGPVVRRRHLGSGWSSRLLQALLVELLDDPAAVAAVAAARDRYDERRAALRTALTARGVSSTAGSGVNLWIEVEDEAAALITLAAAGIRASPGTPFQVRAMGDSAHIRVTSGLLVDGVADVASHIAIAAHKPGSRPPAWTGRRRRPADNALSR
jgi:DNA-binding transcriptional MocR family regulator